MKVLILLSQFDSSGVTTNTLDLYHGLKSFCDTYLLVGKNPKHTKIPRTTTDMYEKYLNDDHVAWFPITERITQLSIHTIITTTKMLFSIINKTFHIHPDIIHCESAYYTFVPWLLHYPFVTTLHITDIYPSMSFKKGRGIIAISEGTKKWAQDILNYKSKDIYTVYHGISKSFVNDINDTEYLNKIHEEFNLYKDKVKIGLVGSIQKRKGHDLLFSAINKMSNETKSKIQIVIVGDYIKQSNKEWLSTLIENSGLKNQVICINHINREKLKDLYRVLDILTLPSRSEGFPMVVIEAMLSKCCVIRSNTEGAYEQIENGQSGYIFENENIEQLSQYLNEVVNNEVIRKKVAKNGQKRALNLFTDDIMAKNTYNVYKTVLSK